MSHRIAVSTAVAILLSGVVVHAQPAPPPRAQGEANVRVELERFEGLLEAAVRKGSRPAPIPVVGVGGGSRAFLMPGFGAVFVLPARTLPSERRVIVMRSPSLRDAASQKARKDMERELTRADAARVQVEIEARSRERQDIDREIQQIEVLAEAYQRDAERASLEADRALARVAQEIRQRFPEAEQTFTFTLPVPPPPPVAPAPAAPAAPRAPVLAEAPPAAPQAPVLAEAPPAAPRAPVLAEAPPAPPWRFWFQAEEDDADSRPASQIVADVRGAITQALETHGASLRVVRAEEVVVVAVDFTRGGFWIRQGRSSVDKTLVVRARKQDLDDRVAGRLPPEEFRKRIHYTEY